MGPAVQRRSRDGNLLEELSSTNKASTRCVCVCEAVVGVSVSKIESCELDFSLCLMERGLGAHLILGSSRPRCIDPHIIIDGAISK